MLQAIKNFIKYVNDNAGAFQFFAAVISTVIACISVYVLWRTLSVISKQAIASEKQALAADEQAKAADEQAKAANKMSMLTQKQAEIAERAANAAQTQSELLSEQIKQSMMPLLVARVINRDNGIVLRLTNDGTGIAYEAICCQGKEPPKVNPGEREVRPLDPTTCGLKEFADIRVPTEWNNELTFRYRSSDGHLYWTVWWMMSGRPWQQHWVEKDGKSVRR